MKNIYKIFLLLVIVFIVVTNSILSQTSFSRADSVLLSSVKNDTTQLRQIVLSRSGERIAAKAQNLIAAILYIANKEDAAELEYRQTYTRYNSEPEKFEAAYYLGKISHHKEKFDKAKKYFEEHVSSPHNNFSAEWSKYYMIKGMLKTNDPQAVSALRIYLGQEHNHSQKNDVSLQYDFIRYLMNRHNYEEALTEAQKMIANYPDSPLSENVKFQIGELNLILGRQNDAIQVYTNIIQNNSSMSEKTARAKLQLAGISDSKNDFAKARQEYNVIIQQHSNLQRWVVTSKYALAMLTYREAMITRDETALKNAFNELTQFVTTYPNDRHAPRSLMALADLNIFSKNYDEAIVQYDKIIQFDISLIPLKLEAAVRSNDVKGHKALVEQAHITKARLLRENKQQPTDALAEYEIILAQSPNNKDAKLNKAMCLIDLGRKGEARTLLLQLVNNQPEIKIVAEQILKTL